MQNNIISNMATRIAAAKIAAVEEEREARIQLKKMPDSVVRDPSTTATAIKQGYICLGENGTDVRIRQERAFSAGGDSPFEGGEEGSKYSMTAKHRPLYQEAETEISPEIFSGLWGSTQKRQVKVRYKWYGWDIDANENGEIWAEYEMPEGQNKIQLPEGWEAV